MDTSSSITRNHLSNFPWRKCIKIRPWTCCFCLRYRFHQTPPPVPLPAHWTSPVQISFWTDRRGSPIRRVLLLTLDRNGMTARSYGRRGSVFRTHFSSDDDRWDSVLDTANSAVSAASFLPNGLFGFYQGQFGPVEGQFLSFLGRFLATSGRKGYKNFSRFFWEGFPSQNHRKISCS